MLEIKDTEVIIESENEKITIENDWVLAMTGYQPNLDFLQKIGINLSDDAQRKPQINEETMETNVEGLYLAGVICGGMNTHSLFIENSRVHANLLVKHIKTKV